MSRLLAVMRRDFEHVRGNVIALVVCAGLAVLPSLYAWFNIAGSWDPYGNTGNVSVALANSDEGYAGGIIPFRVNIGERVVSTLAGSDKIHYVVTSEDDAIEGVRSGAYYAAIVVPADFTSSMMTALSDDAVHPQLRYYVNQKENAIASIVTSKASGSVRTTIDETFDETVTAVAAGVLNDLSGYLDDGSLLSLAGLLDEALADASSALRRASSDLGGYEGLVGAMGDVVDASSAIVGDGSVTLDAAGMLREGASGVRSLDTAVTGVTDEVNGAITSGLTAAGDVEAAISDAYDVTDAQVDRLVEALGKADEAAIAQHDALQAFRDALDAMNGQVYSLVAELETQGSVASVDIAYAHEVQTDITGLIERVDSALGYANDLVDSIESTIDDLERTQADSQTNREELLRLAAQAREGIEGVQLDYEQNLRGSLGGLADELEEAADKAEGVSASLEGTVRSLEPVVSGAQGGLGELELSLASVSDKLGGAADKVDDLRDRLASAMEGGDLDTIRTIIGSDPEGLASFIAAPVEVVREPVYAIQNNGSAMTPYYTTMALWVGGTLMGVLFLTGLSQEALEETGAKPRHAYFGRLAFFLAVGALQSTIVCLGDLFFLGVQCEHPLLFLLVGWVASTTFINIIYSLATSFGDVGKAIAVLFMVIQVAGSGGTFPVQMLPAPFQVVYPYLPFVQSENAMRAAMFGIYHNDYWVSLGKLALFLVPALLLGLLLRKPFVRVNRWFEEQLEETRLM